MKFRHLLNNYSLQRVVVKPMPVFVDFTAQDSPIDQHVQQVRRLELKLYCDFTYDRRDSAHHAQHHAEHKLMHALYGDVMKAAYDIESRLHELGIFDDKLLEMLHELQKVEV